MRISDWSSDVCSSDLRANVEEVQFLRAPRRHRGARERLAPGERVQERRLADVRAARERDLGNGSVGQKLQRRRGFEESDRAGEGLADRKSTRLNSSH